MPSTQTKVVLKTIVEVIVITSIAPMLFIWGADALLMILLIQGFNAALNIVAYEYAIRGYFAARVLSDTLEVLKAQTAPAVKPPGRLRRWLRR